MEFSENPIVRWITNIRNHGIEYASRRFYSLYSASVADNSDATFQGRVMARISALGFGIPLDSGDFEPDVYDRSILPSSIYAGKDHGIYFPPEIGDSVWVSFDYGDPERPGSSYQGSYWTSEDPAVAELSALPSEFRATYSGPEKRQDNRVILKQGSPLVRGIKTRFGHGLIFSDDETAPYVALWSGQQIDARQDARRKQQLRLSDDEKKAGIFANTFYGHKIELNDTDKSITISGLDPDPSGALANSIKIDDITGSITIKTKNQQVITINDATLTTSVSTPGVCTVSATGGVAIASGSGPPVVSAPPGTSVETGAGAKISNFLGSVTETVGGSYSQTVVGTSTQNIIGGMVQNVVGAMVVTAASLNLAAALMSIIGNVVLGVPASAKPLVNDQLILQWLRTHTHGAPGTPPVEAATLLDPLDSSKANPLFVTQNVLGS